MPTVPALTLNNGIDIPQLGLGVYQVPPEDTQRVVETALELGYRHIDTAQMYGNEAGVGAAVAASGLDRAEVFVTSKLNNNRHDPQAALRSFDGTLDTLGFEYVDLFLIHWPLPAVGPGPSVCPTSTPITCTGWSRPPRWCRPRTRWRSAPT